MEAMGAWISEHPFAFAGLLLGTGLFFLFLHDVFQKKHAIIHNFPLVGHLRYLLESIGPELRQYLVAHDKEEAPFNRNERRWVYATAKGENANFGFGSTEVQYGLGYPIIKHAAFPLMTSEAWHREGDETAIPCLKVMGLSHGRRRPYRPQSVINISAMSYGSLGRNAISALNCGAISAGCYHNTGEGGISPYHRLGAELMWQLGTGYYGARDAQGNLDVQRLADTVRNTPQIRAIELKLSQGAKPGKGGILPAAKVTAEIALIRGIEKGRECVSPSRHRAFDTVDGLIDLIERMADVTGLPVGIKSAVGQIAFWEELGERMKARSEGPDFVAIDGGEGGTGAAPLTYSDHVSLPFKVGFGRVYQTMQQAGVSDDIVWIGSGKLGFPDRALVAFAMGCDMIHIAREAMLSIGCIQAQKCHTGHCPTGVATHNRWLQAGLNAHDKSERFARFVKGLRKELLSLAHTMGYQHPVEVRGEDIELSTGVNTFTPLSDVLGYTRDAVDAKRLAALKETRYP